MDLKEKLKNEIQLPIVRRKTLHERVNQVIGDTNYISLPQIRNKLSPVSNVLEMMEEIPELVVLFDPIFLDELQKAKRAIETLTRGEDEQETNINT